MNTPLYFWTQAGFVLLMIVYFGLLLAEIRKAIRLTGWDPWRRKTFFRRLTAGLMVWVAFIAGWSLSGNMENFANFPFNLLPVIIIPLITLALLLRSNDFASLARSIPAETIIRLQSFRFFVEILLWMLFIGGRLPVQMTFEGRNFDILVGISAPAIAFLLTRAKITRTGIVIWNILGLGLLINIVTIALLSTPSPWRVFTNEPANYIVTQFPIALLPGLLVPLAYYLHAISLKQAFQRRSTSRKKDQHATSIET